MHSGKIFADFFIFAVPEGQIYNFSHILCSCTRQYECDDVLETLTRVLFPVPQDFVKSKIYPVLIISYEMFLRSHDALKAVTFDLLVCDEGHRLKNAGAKTTAVSSALNLVRHLIRP